ncbi:hypothetical protein C3747_11g38 [Trypanosoma cruzi]|uniref:Uncharacterized protein n=2 Tax=Trypanosoma cruzi TaxID=5693 RepID=Q4DHZ7_TRYCC|nr:hypothetical protein, conserved [Trypanosoma cruzi]EAN92161.1 hypothetical protein, conserved [Trypanosoma cruzi]KAF8297271.1 hypothetical protein TcYC6_0083950 [Trypanosoma cruzi]PWV18935.1 hypothetical protein C3747_11g38 [Trypanosoma cruzi]RNC59463.1 putative mitochondrial putative multi-pass transmembrane protein [Trypanosoma cruzi]|eukprot:XP_814012.1 hypothetical protein [Trypanosoma cruzi strain CL Brener]
MAISEKKCLFIRVALYLLFIAAYAAGVVVFIIIFSNYWAAAGFFLACIFIAITTVLYVVPDKKLTARLPPGSFSRIIFQSTILIGTLGLFAVALYLLARGIMLKQRWTGSSYFCSFIAFMMAAKWCYFIGYRVHGLRNDTRTIGKADPEEIKKFFEDVPDAWSNEKNADIM